MAVVVVAGVGKEKDGTAAGGRMLVAVVVVVVG